MNYVIGYTLNAVQLICFIAILPFLAIGFVAVKLMGGDPMSMDGMGTDFIIMVIVAIIAAVATGAFAIGYLINL
jgi:uncharacterized membrane protein YwzB